MTNQDQKYKTLTGKSRFHKKAKFMNSDTVSQTDSQTDRQTDRQIGRAIDKIVLFLKDILPQWTLLWEHFNPMQEVGQKNIQIYQRLFAG